MPDQLENQNNVKEGFLKNISWKGVIVIVLAIALVCGGIFGWFSYSKISEDLKIEKKEHLETKEKYSKASAKISELEKQTNEDVEKLKQPFVLNGVLQFTPDGKPVYTYRYVKKLSITQRERIMQQELEQRDLIEVSLRSEISKLKKVEQHGSEYGNMISVQTNTKFNKIKGDAAFRLLGPFGAKGDVMFDNPLSTPLNSVQFEFEAFVGPAFFF